MVCCLGKLAAPEQLMKKGERERECLICFNKTLTKLGKTILPRCGYGRMRIGRTLPVNIVLKFSPTL